MFEQQNIQMQINEILKFATQKRRTDGKLDKSIRNRSTYSKNEDISDSCGKKAAFLGLDRAYLSTASFSTSEIAKQQEFPSRIKSIHGSRRIWKNVPEGAKRL